MNNTGPYFFGGSNMETLGRISEVIAFCVVIFNGCFLDSVDIKPFVIRIVVAIFWILFIELIMGDVTFTFEE